MRIFWLLSLKMHFCKGGWVLGRIPNLFLDFLNILYCPKIHKVLSPFENLWGNSKLKSIILDIKLRFTCRKSNLDWNTVNCQNIMTRVVVETILQSLMCHQSFAKVLFSDSEQLFNKPLRKSDSLKKQFNWP